MKTITYENYKKLKNDGHIAAIKNYRGPARCNFDNTQAQKGSAMQTQTINEYALLNHLREIGEYRPDVAWLHDAVLARKMTPSLALKLFNVHPRISTFEKDLMQEGLQL